MYWKLIGLEVIALIVTLLFSKLIIMLLQNCVGRKGYRLTRKFTDVITFIIILIFGILIGKGILYIFL